MSGTDPISILWARLDHAAELARLHAQLFDPAWNSAAFEQMLSDPGSLSLVALAGPTKEMAGFIIARLAADEAEILSMGVEKRWQRHGIGRSLVEALGRAARKAEARSVHLEVAGDNDAALGLYRSLGFEPSGTRQGYYERAGLPPTDAVRMVLHL